MTEQMEQMIFNEGYRRGKEEEHKWWSFHCAKCTDADRPKGEWIFRHEVVEDTPFTGYRCSNCNYWQGMGAWNFCPQCGADMRGEEDAD